jgi:hypothetical protein
MLASHTSSVGSVTADTKVAVVLNGDAGASVTCTVAGSGPFSVNAQASQNDKSLSISIPSIAPSASQQAPAMGQLAYSSAKTAGNPYSGACALWFTASTPETVAPGKVWLTFACPALVSGMSTCPIQQGYALFENCNQI